jgi:hypothetical protein
MTDIAANLDAKPAVVLRPSKIKWMRVSAICLGFVAVGAALIATGAASWVGWISIGFFGPIPLIVLVARVVFPGNRLEIDDDGFTLWSFGRSRRIAWRETWSIYTGVSGVTCAIDCDAPNHELIELPDIYSVTPAALASIMNERRARADACEGFDAVREKLNQEAERIWGVWC